MTTNSVNPKMFAFLERAWKDVEKDYIEEKLNSEHCLQAALYCALRKILDPSAYTILVEPVFNPENKKPDLVIRDETSVHCVIELKMMPHFFVPLAKFGSSGESVGRFQ